MAQTIIKNGKRNIADLQKELNLLRSFLIGIAGKDKEGNYRPEFVRKILRNAQAKERFIFKDRKSFFSCIRSK
ncbi:MAG: hypothetical protein ABH813_00550 [Patescibacteria group bacterium]